MASNKLSGPPADNPIERDSENSSVNSDEQLLV
jgi:hypothetical protein